MTQVIIRDGVMAITNKSWGTAFPKILHVRPAEPQISLRIHACRQSRVSHEDTLDPWFTYIILCEYSDLTADAQADLSLRTCNGVGNAVYQVRPQGDKAFFHAQLS